MLIYKLQYKPSFGGPIQHVEQDMLLRNEYVGIRVDADYLICKPNLGITERAIIYKSSNDQPTILSIPRYIYEYIRFKNTSIIQPVLSEMYTEIYR